MYIYAGTCLFVFENLAIRNHTFRVRPRHFGPIFWGGGKGEEDERSFVDFRYWHRRNSWPSSYIVCNMYVCAIHTVQARVAFLPPPPRPQPRALLSSSVLPDLRRFHVSPEINQKLTSNYDVGETDSQGSRVERVTSTRRNKHTERFRQKVNEMKVAVYSKTRENAYN